MCTLVRTGAGPHDPGLLAQDLRDLRDLADLADLVPAPRRSGLAGPRRAPAASSYRCSARLDQSWPG